MRNRSLSVTVNRFMAFMYGILAAVYFALLVSGAVAYWRRDGLFAFLFVSLGIAAYALFPFWVAPGGAYVLYKTYYQHIFPQNQAILLGIATFALMEWLYFANRAHPEVWSSILRPIGEAWDQLRTPSAVLRARQAALERQKATVSRQAHSQYHPQPYPPQPRGAYPVQIQVPQEARPMPQPMQVPVQAPKMAVRTPKLDAFDKLVGVDDAIEAIKDALELPLRYPEKIKEYGIKPSRGILLYGPPGTGKTSLARATAEYFACYFKSIKASEVLTPLVGTTEQQLRELFEEAWRNRPSVIFFDEIDSIARKRDGMHLNRPSDLVLNVLLAEMDGFDDRDGIFIIGATNRVDVLDEAILRPGRFDRQIEIGLPDLTARKKLWELYLRDKPQRGKIDYDFLAQASEGMSPADIQAVTQRAALAAVKKEIAGGPKGVDSGMLFAFLRERQGGGTQCR